MEARVIDHPDNELIIDLAGDIASFGTPMCSVRRVTPNPTAVQLLQNAGAHIFGRS